jgi:pimeloyl-ACP methyl ester carboxylesterase
MRACIPIHRHNVDNGAHSQRNRGLRAHACVQVDVPPYWTHEEFCDGFVLFLDQVGAETVGGPAQRSGTVRAWLKARGRARLGTQIHLFGTSVGGLLAQVFAHRRTNRVESLLLCNAYCDTRPFAESAPFLGLYVPHRDRERERGMLADVQAHVCMCAHADRHSRGVCGCSVFLGRPSLL